MRYRNPIVCIFVGVLLFCSISCTSKKIGEELANVDIRHISMSIDDEYYQPRLKDICDTSFVILHENADGMISDIDKIIEKNGALYILDQFSARTVVSFDKNGIPMAKYGANGKGEGEYLIPMDMWVDDDGVYVLASNLRKLIEYDHSGAFRKQHSLNFLADAFVKLKDGNFMFSLMPEGSESHQLCITDSNFKPIKSMLPYDKNYKEGYHTCKILYPSGSDFKYYRSPSDKIYRINSVGEIKAVEMIDFSGKTLPEKIRMDYMTYRDEAKSGEYLWPVNSPFEVNDSTWVVLAEDGMNQYTIIYNPIENKSGGRLLDRKSSIYGINYPVGVGERQNIISLILPYLEEVCADYKSLPDSVQRALDSGMQVLMLNDIGRTQ